MQVIDGARIARLRRARGYTQRDLAALCKCSQNTISLIERGDMRTLRPELADLITKRLRPEEGLPLFIERISASPMTTDKRVSTRGRAA